MSSPACSFAKWKYFSQYQSPATTKDTISSQTTFMKTQKERLCHLVPSDSVLDTGLVPGGARKNTIRTKHGLKLQHVLGDRCAHSKLHTWGIQDHYYYVCKASVQELITPDQCHNNRNHMTVETADHSDFRATTPKWNAVLSECLKFKTLTQGQQQGSAQRSCTHDAQVRSKAEEMKRTSEEQERRRNQPTGSQAIYTVLGVGGGRC